ncbi:MAG: hypothetical protein PHV30_07120 [Candidatus Margulisbacteria bacterium]|nr:hypothetical protein [Candidatus Margulisiibacteriota bacterium]
MQNKHIAYNQYTSVSRPITVDQFTNFNTYGLPGHTKKTNDSFKIGFIDMIATKYPTKKFFKNFLFNLTREHSTNAFKRSIKNLLWEKVEVKWPQISSIDFSKTTDRVSFFLYIHLAHYERLKEKFANTIPQTKFILNKKGIFGSNILTKLYPVIIQEKINGVHLFEMFNKDPGYRDGEKAILHDKWTNYRKIIAAQLRPYIIITNNLFIDLSLKHFIFNPENLTLYYLNIKPEIFVDISHNEKIKSYLMEHFL